MAVVGIDVGGTDVKAGLLDRAGAVVAAEREPTPDRADHLIDAMESIVRTLTARSREAVDAVGVGLAAFVERPSGEVRGSVNTALDAGVPGRLLGRRLGLPVVVDNDANAAGLAEYRLGAAQGTASAIVITLGTGVGGAVIQDGRLMRGGRGLGAELGHVVVRADGPPCPGPGCPNTGCIEAFVGARALALAATASALADPRGPLATAIAAGAIAGPRVVGELAVLGDDECRAILDRAGRALGAGLSGLANTFVPEVIVIGGGVGELGELLLGPAQVEFSRRVLSPSAATRIVPAALGPEAGMIGAGLLAIERNAA